LQEGGRLECCNSVFAKLCQVATPQPEINVIIDLGKWQIPEETDVQEETITN
jgi:hypothetical protein